MPKKIIHNPAAEGFCGCKQCNRPVPVPLSDDDTRENKKAVDMANEELIILRGRRFVYAFSTNNTFIGIEKNSDENVKIMYWIDIKDELPPDPKPVLLRDTVGNILSGCYNKRWKFFYTLPYSHRLVCIKYWCQLPEMPVNEEK